MRTAWLALGVLLAADAAQAQDAEARNSPQLKACRAANKIPDSRIGMTLCIGQEADRLDGLIGQALQEALNGRSDADQAALRQGQATWTAYRDADCKGLRSLWESKDPHQALLVYDDCRLTRNARRLTDFQNLKAMGGVR